MRRRVYVWRTLGLLLLAGLVGVAVPARCLAVERWDRRAGALRLYQWGVTLGEVLGCLERRSRGGERGTVWRRVCGGGRWRFKLANPQTGQ